MQTLQLKVIVDFVSGRDVFAILYGYPLVAEKVCAMAHGCLPGILDRIAFASDRTVQ